MRFASIVEDLGTSFLSSLMTLVVFLPILWDLSANITELPIFGAVPGSLVWVALVVAAFGTALLWIVGIRLPGLNFENQKVEAALRKELVYGEDDADRADPPTFRELFANVQKNYFRLYFHYTYFNLARYAYLQVAGYVPLLTLSPSILAGTLTLGLYQQVQQRLRPGGELVPVLRPRLDDHRRAAVDLHAPARVRELHPAATRSRSRTIGERPHRRADRSAVTAA